MLENLKKYKIVLASNSPETTEFVIWSGYRLRGEGNFGY